MDAYGVDLFFLLSAYLITDLFLSHPLTMGLDLTLSGENIFNKRMEVSASPVINLGAPRSLRIGLRYRHE